MPPQASAVWSEEWIGRQKNRCVDASFEQVREITGFIEFVRGDEDTAFVIE